MSNASGHATSGNYSSCSSGAEAGLSASPDLTKAPPPLDEESSLEPALVLAPEEELPLENASEPLAEAACSPSPIRKFCFTPSYPH